MKLYYPLADTVIDIESEKVPSLVMESPKSFFGFLQDIQNQLDGKSGESVLSVQDRPVDMSRYVEIITTFVPFEINRKTLLTKVISYLEKKAVDAEHYMVTQKLLTDLELYVDDLASDSPCDIVTDRISIGPVLKSLGIIIRDEYTDQAEKILDYMELVREFDRDRLFILVNSRSYFEPDTLELFLHSVKLHGYRVLLVDSHAEEILPSEKRLTIDRDLCVF